MAFVAVRSRTLAREGRPVPTGRLCLIAAGVAVGVLADLPPLGTASEERLSVHMLQHMLIGDLAAFLIAIGMTGPLLQPILVKPGVRRLRWLAHPLVAVPLWVVIYYAWHVPALYQAALHSNVVHATEHATMFAAGLALWMGLLGPLPKPSWFGNAAGLAYVLIVRFAGTVIANVFLWSSSPFYPDYVALAKAQRDRRRRGPEPGRRDLDDRGLDRDDLRARLAVHALDAPGRGGRGARRVRAREGRSSWTRRGRAGRWRPARARGCAPGWAQKMARPSRTRTAIRAADRDHVEQEAKGLRL